MAARNSEKNRESNSLQWTNEKHLHFLNSMEASFVQTMLQNNGRFAPLDRYLPDTSDSTQDLDKYRPRRTTFVSARWIIEVNFGFGQVSREDLDWCDDFLEMQTLCDKKNTSGDLNLNVDNVESSGRRIEKKTRILACQKSSQDQVVPQFENKRDDKDKDDNRSS